MAETTKNERKKMFDEMISSIEEYSTEAIVDPKSLETEILQLLQTHRAIKLCDFEYGFSKIAQPNHRLIIKESEDNTKVREYTLHAKTWRCCNCYSQRYKCTSSNLQIVSGIVLAPTNHSNICETRDYEAVMKVQNLLKQNKTREARALVIAGRKRSQPNALNRSQLPTSMANESLQSNVDENDVSINGILEEPTSETLASNIQSQRSSPAFSEPVSESITLNVKHEAAAADEEDDDDEDCMVLDEPGAKKPKIEIKTEGTFRFDRPSSVVLEQRCKKLNIDMYNNAYKLWGDMIFRYIPPNAKKIQTHPFKSPNIFTCLSLLFSAKTADSCFLIQHVINAAFRNHLMASGEKSDEDIDQILVCNTVSDEEIQFMAKFLKCRIGIYYDGVLKKFGKWHENDIDVLTLILCYDASFYSVVLDLEQ